MSRISDTVGGEALIRARAMMLLREFNADADPDSALEEMSFRLASVELDFGLITIEQCMADDVFDEDNEQPSDH